MKKATAAVFGILLLAGALSAQGKDVHYLHGTTDVEVTWDVSAYLGHYKAWGGGREKAFSDLYLGPNGTGTVQVDTPDEETPKIGGGVQTTWHWYSPAKKPHELYWGVLAKKDGSVAVNPNGSLTIFIVREKAQDGEDYLGQFTLETSPDKVKSFGGAWIWERP
jgi:hypothetical protein